MTRMIEADRKASGAAPDEATGSNQAPPPAPEPLPRDRPAPTPRKSAHLKVVGLRKTFGDRAVLGRVDLEVARGECIALLGANGSGKSTMLRCVIGLTTADGGTIEVAGRNGASLHGYALAAHRRELAMIFQQIHLVQRRNAIDNVCTGALGRLSARRSLSPLLFPADLRTEAMRCLARVGLADRAGDRVKSLSGGQQQRVAIARALCQRASVVLADEPVAALDPAASEQVMGLLADLAHDQDFAVCTVLHQPDLARRHADRIVGLMHGEIVFDAPPESVSDAEIASLYAPEET